MKSYVIKCQSQYLHSVKGKMEFLPEKHGCLIYDPRESDIVMKILKSEGFKGVFRAAVKDKRIKERPSTLIDGVRKRWAEKSLKKKIKKSEGNHK